MQTRSKEKKKIEQQKKEEEENLSKTLEGWSLIDAEKKKVSDVVNAIIYCRVSSEKQRDGISLDVQQQVCTDYCSSRGWRVVTVIREIASARSPKRQKLLLSVNRMYDEKTKLVVYNVSRFSRNVSKGLELARTFRDSNLDLVSSMEMLDASSPSGEFNLTNLLNAAEFERLMQNNSKMIGKRVADALAKKKAEGHQLGTPKYGFRACKVDGIRKFVVDEKEADVIDFVAKCRTSGTKLSDLNDAMKKICDPDQYVPIKFNGKEKVLVEALSTKNIRSLLHSYKVFRRGKKWSEAAVERLYQR